MKINSGLPKYENVYLFISEGRRRSRAIHYEESESRRRCLIRYPFILYVYGDDSTHAIQHGQFLYGFSNI